MSKYEYIVASGDYGTLEDTLNYYGDLGWIAVVVDLHFNQEPEPNMDKELRYVPSASQKWCVVFERLVDDFPEVVYSGDGTRVSGLSPY